MFLYLAFKEMWRNKGRYLLISLVVALITTLVLFVAALAEGLAASNIQFLSKLDADLVLYKENADLSIQASRIRLSELNDVARLPTVQSAGPIGSSSATVIFNDGTEMLDVSLIGIEPGKPGTPPAFEGRSPASIQDEQAIIGRNVARQTGLTVGDTLVLQTVQAAEEKLHRLEISGISDGRQNLFRPSVFVPYVVWNRIKPQAEIEPDPTDIFINLIAVKLAEPVDSERMSRLIENRLPDLEAVDRQTAYEATPGYQAQQNTLTTQRVFSLVIGVLVIGGFFQIQILQKVPQIGMLKAIGVPNRTVALTAVAQILAVTLLGVSLGGLGSLLLTLAFPASIPLSFSVDTVAVALGSLLLIGPIGGLVSIRSALQVEPLTALGLTQ